MSSFYKLTGRFLKSLKKRKHSVFKPVLMTDSNPEFTSASVSGQNYDTFVLDCHQNHHDTSLSPDLPPSPVCPVRNQPEDVNQYSSICPTKSTQSIPTYNVIASSDPVCNDPPSYQQATGLALSTTQPFQPSVPPTAQLPKSPTEPPSLVSHKNKNFHSNKNTNTVPALPPAYSTTSRNDFSSGSSRDSDCIVFSLALVSRAYDSCNTQSSNTPPTRLPNSKSCPSNLGAPINADTNLFMSTPHNQDRFLSRSNAGTIIKDSGTTLEQVEALALQLQNFLSRSQSANINPLLSLNENTSASGSEPLESLPFSSTTNGSSQNTTSVVDENILQKMSQSQIQDFLKYRLYLLEQEKEKNEARLMEEACSSRNNHASFDPLMSRRLSGSLSDNPENNALNPPTQPSLQNHLYSNPSRIQQRQGSTGSMQFGRPNHLNTPSLPSLQASAAECDRPPVLNKESPALDSDSTLPGNYFSYNGTLYDSNRLRDNSCSTTDASTITTGSRRRTVSDPVWRQSQDSSLLDISPSPSFSSSSEESVSPVTGHTKDNSTGNKTKFKPWLLPSKSGAQQFGDFRRKPNLKYVGRKIFNNRFHFLLGLSRVCYYFFHFIYCLF